MKTFSVALLLSMSLFACSDNPTDAGQKAQQQGVPVDVAPVIARRITQWDNFTGRLVAPQTVSLRPRVSGYIDFVAFEEGEWVEQGQTLFLIDNRRYKAEVDRLTAQLSEARSRYSLAKTNYQRAEKLSASQSVSQEVIDARQTEMQQADAALAQTQAQLDVARLNRGFARVQAPISGRISRASVTAGNFVSAGQTELTTIVSTDKLHAYFDIDEQTYLNYVASQSGNRAVDAQPVAMKLANQASYEHWGYIDFIDNQVSAQTGTLRVRAVFSNEKGTLLPGLFAHLKLAGESDEKGILIADKAINTDLNNKYVLVIDKENKAQYRAVTLGDKVGELRIIEGGLEQGDEIVVAGLQRVRPGAPVAPNPVKMADEDALTALDSWQARVDAAMQLALKQDEPVTAGLR
ncbi:efflux RND transporter periplasmic adaptor subunit [Alteromonas halophila]|uniref:efflux RND transporter periplasmic adaptor subunit n=1 Tax=Alteromonas halophila TaxID=516698 RepID=UPI00357132AA